MTTVGGSGRLIDLPVRSSTQKASQEVVSHSISFLSGSLQVAIWRLTRAFSHGLTLLSGDAFVYCDWAGNNNLQVYDHQKIHKIYSKLFH